MTVHTRAQLAVTGDMSEEEAATVICGFPCIALFVSVFVIRVGRIP